MFGNKPLPKTMTTVLPLKQPVHFPSLLITLSKSGYRSGKGSEGFKRLKNNLLKTVFFLLLFSQGSTVLACTTCNKNLQAGIFDTNFGWYLLAIFIPFVVMGALVTILYRFR